MTTKRPLPPDVDPQSGFRLPLLPRDALDEEGKAVWDRAQEGQSLAGLRGPSGIKLYSPKAARLSSALNRFLRYEAGIEARAREVAILATARELDSRFEWSAHEPEALEVGVPPEVVDVIKHRRPTTGLAAEDAVLIQLVREMWGDHRVKPETFAAAKARFGAKLLVHLVMLSGSYGSTAALLCAFDMQLPDGDDVAELPVP